MFGSKLKVSGGYLGVFSSVAIVLLQAFGVQLPAELQQILLLVCGGAGVAGAKVLRDAPPK
jgi:hypothetical protein